MTMTMNTRGQTLWWTMVWFVGILVGLWIFVLLFGELIEPLHSFATDLDAVEGTSYESAADLLLQTMSVAGLLLGVGAVALIIVFAVWKEGFLGQRRRRP